VRRVRGVAAPIARSAPRARRELGHLGAHDAEAVEAHEVHVGVAAHVLGLRVREGVAGLRVTAAHAARGILRGAGAVGALVADRDEERIRREKGVSVEGENVESEGVGHREPPRMVYSEGSTLVKKE
jgi:hypothetical protein